MIIGHILIERAGTEQFGVVKGFTQQLHTDGHTLAVETAGQREPGQPREVHRYGIDIAEIHCQRIF